MYHNEPLKSLVVNNINWNGSWFTSAFEKGGGVLLEGVIRGRSRHVVADSSTNKWRYFVIHVKVTRAARRQFDAAGKEVEPNFDESEKIRTGYLNSSYKTVIKGKSDVLSTAQLSALVQKHDLLRLTENVNRPDCFAFWLEESQLDGIEVADGDELRIKTKGDGPFVETLAKLDAQTSTVCNYAGGEKVGSSWTDKVMLVKASSQEDSSSPTMAQTGDGAADDEWND